MWRDHCDQLNTIRNVFIKLDRFKSPAIVILLHYQLNLFARGYCLQQSTGFGIGSPPVQPIWDMGHGLLRAQLEQSPLLLSRLVSAMLAAIECYRSVSANIVIIECEREILIITGRTMESII